MTMKSLLTLLQREQELLETRGVLEREITSLLSGGRLAQIEKELVANRMEMAEHLGLPPRIFKEVHSLRDEERMAQARKEHQATKREIDKAAAKFRERAEAGIAPLESGELEGRISLKTAEPDPTHVARAAGTAGQGAGLAFQAVPRAVDSIFTPGVVKVSCGCSPERAAQCQQKGQWHDTQVSEEPVKNEQCHVFVHELDLLDMTFDVIKARFASAAEAEKTPSLDGVLNFLYRCEDNYDLESYQRDALYALTDVLRNKR